MVHNYVQYQEHFQDLKVSVVLPLVEIVKSDEKLSAFLPDQEGSVVTIDNDLFADFFDNHYPQLKLKWDDILNTLREILSLSSKMNSMIDNIIVLKLNSYGIKHAYDENGLPSTDYIIIPVFRERVVKCMEDNLDINTEIIRHDYEPYLILFKAEMSSVAQFTYSFVLYLSVYIFIATNMLYNDAFMTNSLVML